VVPQEIRVRDDRVTHLSTGASVQPQLEVQVVILADIVWLVIAIRPRAAHAILAFVTHGEFLVTVPTLHLLALLYRLPMAIYPRSLQVKSLVDGFPLRDEHVAHDHKVHHVPIHAQAVAPVESCQQTIREIVNMLLVIGKHGEQLIAFLLLHGLDDETLVTAKVQESSAGTFTELLSARLSKRILVCALIDPVLFPDLAENMRLIVTENESLLVITAQRIAARKVWEHLSKARVLEAALPEASRPLGHRGECRMLKGRRAVRCFARNGNGMGSDKLLQSRLRFSVLQGGVPKPPESVLPFSLRMSPALFQRHPLADPIPLPRKENKIVVRLFSAESSDKMARSESSIHAGILVMHEAAVVLPSMGRVVVSASVLVVTVLAVAVMAVAVLALPVLAVAVAAVPGAARCSGAFAVWGVAFIDSGSVRKRRALATAPAAGPATPVLRTVLPVQQSQPGRYSSTTTLALTQQSFSQFLDSCWIQSCSNGWMQLSDSV